MAVTILTVDCRVLNYQWIMSRCVTYYCQYNRLKFDVRAGFLLCYLYGRRWTKMVFYIYFQTNEVTWYSWHFLQSNSSEHMHRITNSERVTKSSFGSRKQWRRQLWAKGLKPHPRNLAWAPKFYWTFLPRCMECRRGLAMRILSVRLSVCLSNAWIVTKLEKNQSRCLYHTKDHLG